MASTELPASDELLVQLFYGYVELPDPEDVVSQQQDLCGRLGLTGRMRIASEGINGILCGTSAQLARYREAMAAPGSPLHGLTPQYKLSPAGGADPMGGELFVRVTDEITATGEAVKAHRPTALGGDGGTHLSARDFHEALLTEPAGRRRVLIDTRSHYETAVGTFEGAVDPKIRTFAQFPSWVEANLERLEGAGEEAGGRGARRQRRMGWRRRAPRRSWSRVSSRRATKIRHTRRSRWSRCARRRAWSSRRRHHSV